MSRSERRYARRMDVESENLVGMTEIAEKAEVKLDTVIKWRARHYDFPAPILELKMGPVWNWPDIEKWLKSSGRL